MRILTLHCFAPSRLSPYGLTAATSAQPPLLMLQSRGQIPAATRHVRLWDAGKGHRDGVAADPVLTQRSSAHTQLRGGSGWWMGHMPHRPVRGQCGAHLGVPTEVWGIPKAGTAKAVPIPLPCCGQSCSHLMVPSASIAIMGWGHRAEIPLLTRSATAHGEDQGASLLYPTPFGLQLHVLPAQSNAPKGSVCAMLEKDGC